jgi:hypothetical protein
VELMLGGITGPPCHWGVRWAQIQRSGLIDVGKVIRLTHRLRSTLKKHYFSASGTHFCSRLGKPQDLVRLEGSGKLKKKNHLPHRLSNQVKICPYVDG